MLTNRQVKESEIKKIEKLIQEHDVIIVWDYSDLSANDINSIKKNFKSNNIRNHVFKNRLAKIAFKNNKMEEIIDKLIGPSSFFFGNLDNLPLLKVIEDFGKKIKKDDIFKYGYVTNTFYDSKAVKVIATLPSKEVLITKVAFVLQENIRKLAVAIDQVSKIEEKK